MKTHKMRTKLRLEWIKRMQLELLVNKKIEESK